MRYWDLMKLVLDNSFWDKTDLFGLKMNFPYASHMGGVWERQIRCQKCYG